MTDPAPATSNPAGEPCFHVRADGVRLAYRHRPGRGPTVVFLPGYASDMAGAKASALDAWAADEGRAMLRFDYSGCGESGGDFEAGTIDIWRDDALAVIDAVTEGTLILVGSSMGGWLMLLVALARDERIAALVGIAAAPDFTDWGFTDEKRLALADHGRIVEEAADGGAPRVTTAAFWRSGEANRLLGLRIDLDCPVRLLHGQADADVPYELSLRLAAQLGSADVETILIKDGDHRLSRPQDLARLVAIVSSLPEVP